MTESGPVLGRRSSKRWIILAFVATVLLCAAVVPIEAYRLDHVFRAVDKDQNQARADLTGRAHTFAERLADAGSVRTPSDATIDTLSGSRDILLDVISISRDHSMVVDVKGHANYGLVGQGFFEACFAVTYSDPNTDPVVAEIACPPVTP
jgi:hypothetical protein